MHILDKCGGTSDGKEYDPNKEACCGNAKLSIETHFCYGNNEVRELCNGEGYLENQFCDVDNNVIPRCGGTFLGATYNPNTEACCRTNKYIEETQFCQSGTTVRDKCDGETYLNTEFCSVDNEVKQRCGGLSSGATYNPNTEACCGTTINKYVLETQFCFNETTVGNKCGSSEYNLNTQFCFNNTILDKCGSAEYNPNTQFCFNNTTVGNKCGGSEYNLNTQFCFNNTTVLNKCGGNDYNPDTEICFEDVIWPIYLDDF